MQAPWRCVHTEILARPSTSFMAACWIPAVLYPFLYPFDKTITLDSTLNELEEDIDAFFNIHCGTMTGKNKKRRTADSPNSPSPSPIVCCSEVRDLLLSIQMKLSTFDAHLTLIEELHKDFQSLRESLEYSQEALETLSKNQTSLQQSIGTLQSQISTITSENKQLKETVLDLESRSMRDNLFFFWHHGNINR